MLGLPLAFLHAAEGFPKVLHVGGQCTGMGWQGPPNVHVWCGCEAGLEAIFPGRLDPQKGRMKYCAGLLECCFPIRTEDCFSFGKQ